MDTFTLDVGRSWILRALGRNPLVRLSDRVEAVLAVLLIVAALVVTPVAAAIGTTVHETRARLNAQEAQARHVVTATAIEDGTIIIQRYDEAYRVPVRWLVDGVEHVGSVDVAYATMAGEHLDVWVDDSGKQVAPPPPSWRAGVDAVFAGAGAWLIAMFGIAGVWAFVHSCLTRRRNRGWDAEWMALVGGGRADSQT